MGNAEIAYPDNYTAYKNNLVPLQVAPMELIRLIKTCLSNSYKNFKSQR